jgi:ubiquinone/menaquinone biosynthesis C-methylase UbiE
VARRVDYDEHQHAVYAAGRGLTAPIRQLWSGIFARYIDARTRPEILDLGSGTGMYSELLARQFGARVVGVEPSRRMREIAERDHAHDHVRYIEGSAGQIPVGDACCDVALLSNVIHHVDDRHACAAELHRVVRPGGLVLLRGTLLDSVPGVPFFEFFPTALAIDLQRMPSVAALVAVFASHGLEKVHSEVVEQQSAVDLQDYYDRVKHRAVSTLELIDDADFEQGIERMREAASSEQIPTPVFEPVNLVVFRR